MRGAKGRFVKEVEGITFNEPYFQIDTFSTSRSNLMSKSNKFSNREFHDKKN